MLNPDGLNSDVTNQNFETVHIDENFIKTKFFETFKDKYQISLRRDFEMDEETFELYKPSKGKENKDEKLRKYHVGSKHVAFLIVPKNGDGHEMIEEIYKFKKQLRELFSKKEIDKKTDKDESEKSVEKLLHSPEDKIEALSNLILFFPNVAKIKLENFSKEQLCELISKFEIKIKAIQDEEKARKKTLKYSKFINVISRFKGFEVVDEMTNSSFLSSRQPSQNSILII